MRLDSDAIRAFSMDDEKKALVQRVTNEELTRFQVFRCVAALMERIEEGFRSFLE